MPDVITHADDLLNATLLVELERQYGPLLGGEALRQALGYPSRASLRQAYYQQRVPVPVFKIPRRRGFFALTRDVAQWLCAVRLNGMAERMAP
jgi:hypothetical protein